MAFASTRWHLAEIQGDSHIARSGFGAAKGAAGCTRELLLEETPGRDYVERPREYLYTTHISGATCIFSARGATDPREQIIYTLAVRLLIR